MTDETSAERRHPLRQIYFYLTKGCNLKCRHCWIAPKYQAADADSLGALDVDLFQDIIRQAKPMGLAGVKLTGGEPLLHPKIADLLDIVQKEELRLNMETNGTLCTPELAKQIAACKSPHAAVSIDGADAETHEWVRGVAGSFEDAKRGVRHLADAGLRPQVIMSLMRHNQEQMADVVRMAESLGAGSVKFNLIQPIARGEALHGAGETLSIGELVELGKWVENELSGETTLKLHYHHPPAFRPLGRMLGDDGTGCGVCGILGILGVLSNGDFALCGIGESVPELVFGNARRDKVEEVWNGSSVLEELREGMPAKLEGICGNCVMKGVCLGSCIAFNYYNSRNLWSPFWFCRQAREAGIFPESRAGAAVG